MTLFQELSSHRCGSLTAPVDHLLKTFEINALPELTVNSLTDLSEMGPAAFTVSDQNVVMLYCAWLEADASAAFDDFHLVPHHIQLGLSCEISFTSPFQTKFETDSY